MIFKNLVQIQKKFLFRVLFLFFIFLSFNSKIFADNNLPIGLFHFEQYHYLNLDKRVGLLTEAEQFIKNSYAGWKYKKNIENIFQDAIETEKAQFTDDKVSDQSYLFATEEYYNSLPRFAKANLDFYDRLRKVLAQFKDSHLIFQNTVPLPYISCDLTLEKIDGKIVFGSANTELNIEKGDELTLIDGMNPDYFLNLVKVYIPASSDLAREKLALSALTFRNFLYPKSVYNQIEFRKLSSGVIHKAQVKWKLGTRNSRDDAYFYLQSIGYEKEDLLKFENENLVLEGQRIYNPEKEFYQSAYSVELDKAIEHFAPNSHHELILRHGYWTYNHNEYGVIQIFSFSYDHTDRGDSFTYLIREALKEFRDAGAPLILDLRNNWGGSADLAMNTAKLFLEEKELISPPGISFVRSTYIINLMSNLDILSPNQKERFKIYGVDLLDFWNRFFEESKNISEEERYKRRRDMYFPVVNGTYIKSNLQGRQAYYPNEIAIMTGPLCRSICEVFVRLLTQKRKILNSPQHPEQKVISVGQATQGTGFGYIENDNETRQFKSSWMDTLSFIKLKVPNFISLESPPQENSILYNQDMSQCTENNAYIPTITYTPTLRDVQENDLDALDFAAKKLKSFIESR